MLCDHSARVLAFGTATNFQTPFPALFKTGTANQYQSIVALGATPRHSVAVWMGNFSGETVIGRTGSSVPAAIVRDTLIFLSSNAHGGSGTKGEQFAQPEDWEQSRVCALSGLAPTAACPAQVDEWVQKGTTLKPCTWHQTLANTTSTIYPAEYQSWFLAKDRRGELAYNSAPLTLLSPREGSVYYQNPAANLLSSSAPWSFAEQNSEHSPPASVIPVEATGGQASELSVHYDNTQWTVQRPFVFYLPIERGTHTLAVRCGNEEQRAVFRVE
jgi:penicillin-binding protein 1C